MWCGRAQCASCARRRHVPLATLGQGDIFGERACVMRQEQIASAIAETDRGCS
jgi:CRP-like cAMP-binding protein